MPLALVPSGSGNALSASTGLWSPATAAHAVVKGLTRPIDVVSVLQPPGRVSSSSYRLLADPSLMTVLNQSRQCWRLRWRETLDLRLVV